MVYISFKRLIFEIQSLNLQFLNASFTQFKKSMSNLQTQSIIVSIIRAKYVRVKIKILKKPKKNVWNEHDTTSKRRKKSFLKNSYKNVISWCSINQPSESHTVWRKRYFLKRMFYQKRVKKEGSGKTKKAEKRS